MRLLELPDPVREALGSGAISAGHARALLPLGDEHLQISFCEQIQREGMSVRAIERAVKDQIESEDSFGTTGKVRRTRQTPDSQVQALEQELKTALGTKVQIKQGARQKGQIVISFTNADEFERFAENIGRWDGDRPQG